MRKLRQLSMAVVFTLALSASTFAGIIGGGPEPPPAPPEPPSVMATGTIDTPPSGAQPVTPTADPIVDVALNLLQSLLLAF
jgi:hypothetical protein